jgi:hypothetical protein
VPRQQRSGRWKQEDPLGFTAVSSCTRDRYYTWCRRKGGRPSLSYVFWQPAALIVGQANKYYKSRNNGTRSQWASVNMKLRLFAVMCVSLHFLARTLAGTFGKNIYLYEHFGKITTSST